MKEAMKEKTEIISWPEYDLREIQKWKRKKVRSTWYLIWGNCFAGFKLPDYFGKFCVALIQRGRELGINLQEESKDLFETKEEK